MAGLGAAALAVPRCAGRRTVGGGRRRGIRPRTEPARAPAGLAGGADDGGGPTSLDLTLALAQHGLAARRIIDRLDHPTLRAAVDLLLAEIGRALAQSLDRADAAEKPGGEPPA